MSSTPPPSPLVDSPLVDSPLMDSVTALARRAHAGQVDKQGRDYFEHHLWPIAASLRPFGEDAVLAGLLHDIVEDTDVTPADLLAAGVPQVVVDAVLAVSRRPEETYPELIARAAAHPLGRLVKLADNYRNLTGLTDLATHDPDAAARLRPRYEQARAVLAASITSAL
jgi:(p)ppGpp synthase/HD superfamily hydrolase